MAESESRGHDITGLLQRLSERDTSAFDALLPLVYDQLKVLARARLRDERTGHTLDPTGLVHEAYLKLVDQTRVEWRSRSHFYAVASECMRRILIDYARTRHRAKRGGHDEHVSLSWLEGDVPDTSWSDDRLFTLIALNQALERLSAVDKRAAQIVEYRYFGGMDHTAIAEVLGVSEVTVRRSWTVAKLWLRRALSESPDRDEAGA